MRTLTAEQKARIEASATTQTEGLKVTLTDSTVMGFTKYAADFVRGGVTYKSRPGMKITNFSTQSGLSVDHGEVDVAYVDGVFTEADIYNRVFDDAIYERLLIDYEDASFVPVILQAGIVGEWKMFDYTARVEMRSLTQKTQQKSGELTSQRCRVRVWGDFVCNSAGNTDPDTGVTPASFAALPGAPYRIASAAVAGVITPMRQFTVAMPAAYPSGFFTDGIIDWLAGANAGRSMDILGYLLDADGVTGTFVLFEPMAYTIAAGNTAKITVGCDRQDSTCRIKFANKIAMDSESELPGQQRSLSVAG